MTKAHQLRKKHIHWLSRLLWDRLNVAYDPVSYHILDMVLATDKPNMAELGKTYGLDRRTMDCRLKKIKRDMEELMEIVK